MAGIYIHTPFCKSKCAYCNFFSLASQSKINDYVEALKKEIVLRKNYLGDETVKTIYFGGGTPSLLSVKNIEGILDLLNKNYEIISSPEITLEINPDTIDREKMESLKQIGINRMSVGIQSFNDEDLKYLGRRHDSRHAMQVLEDLKHTDFEKITLDLIYGMPTLTEEKWNKNLDIFFSTDITHLSAYALTVEPKTILGQRIEKGELQSVSEEETIRHYNILVERTKGNGFEHYEISNFAKEGFRSQHNSIYWRDEKYLGLGPSAHSYDGNSRQWNISNLTKYIQLIGNSEDYFDKEILSRDDKFNEYIMTSLRTSWGCDIEKIERDYGKSYAHHFLKNIKKHLDNGEMLKENNTYFLSEEGKLFADGIAADLFL
ncbi:MAG: radical SAM family heme chaperone HemW [Bacteroidales bacterium]|nr:radical SAM family heme chaperone HemW [Bacteroidales bacterium]